MAEELAVAHMHSLGFTDARRTPHGPDGGLDAIAANAAAQVKNYALPVGAPEVQKLRGAAFGRRIALFYARSGFTAQAAVFADSAGVALFRFTDQNQVEAVNQIAEKLDGPQSDLSQSKLDQTHVLSERISAVLLMTERVIKHLWANLDSLSSLNMTQSDVENLMARCTAAGERFSEWADAVSEQKVQFTVQEVQDRLDEFTGLIAPVLHKLDLNLDDYSNDELVELAPKWGVSREDLGVQLQAAQAVYEINMKMVRSWDLVNAISNDLAERDDLPPRAEGVWADLKTRLAELAERIQTWNSQVAAELTDSAPRHALELMGSELRLGAGLRAEQEGLLAEYCLMFGLEHDQVGI